MIVKPREKPLSILKLQALLRRLPPSHPKVPMITSDLRKREAGYKGECSIDYSLSFLDEKEYWIFHDLRLRDHQYFFQVDTLIMTSKGIILIEVKNMKGTLHFDSELHQLIRSLDGEEQAFPDPLLQVQRHEEQFKRWLQNQKVKLPPIYSLIVISNPQTIIRLSPRDRKLQEKILHREYLHFKILQINESLKEPVLQEKEKKKIGRLLKRNHTAEEFSVLSRYGLEKEEVIQGVICEECGTVPLLKCRKGWSCSKCDMLSRDAHIPALNDYKLLFGDSITNGQLREFLVIPSSGEATRLLRSLNLQSDGKTKGKVYCLSKQKS